MTWNIQFLLCKIGLVITTTSLHPNVLPSRRRAPVVSPNCVALSPPLKRSKLVTTFYRIPRLQRIGNFWKSQKKLNQFRVNHVIYVIYILYIHSPEKKRFPPTKNGKKNQTWDSLQKMCCFFCFGGHCWWGGITPPTYAQTETLSTWPPQIYCWQYCQLPLGLAHSVTTLGNSAVCQTFWQGHMLQQFFRDTHMVKGI